MRGRALKVLKKAAEAAFPSGAGAPDHREADVVRRFLEWQAALPPARQPLVTLLFVAIEALSFLLTGRSYLWLSDAQRLALIQRLRRHRVYGFRLIGDSVKGLLTMIYLASPPVVAHLGMISASEHPADPYRLPVKREALRVIGDREIKADVEVA
jgi:hypothetical protein